MSGVGLNAGDMLVRNAETARVLPVSGELNLNQWSHTSQTGLSFFSGVARGFPKKVTYTLKSERLAVNY